MTFEMQLLDSLFLTSRRYSLMPGPDDVRWKCCNFDSFCEESARADLLE